MLSVDLRIGQGTGFSTMDHFSSYAKGSLHGSIPKTTACNMDNWYNLTFDCSFIKFHGIFVPIGQAFVLGSYSSYQPVIIHSR